MRAFTFDGDTPGDARQAIRLHGDIVVSNPDMLHQAILPHHTKWAQFFENLRYVVIDEVHTYRGVFGSHVANVMRRLQRICAFYGVAAAVHPVLGDDRQSAGARRGADRGRDVHAITESGAPTGDKHVLLWNPPVVNPDLGLRASARSQSNRIARIAIKAGLKTLVFAQSRLMVEVLTKYLKDVFDHDPRKPARIRAYRGGYLPTERRDDRTRDARRPHRRHRRRPPRWSWASTSAASTWCVLNGYPGSIAATWQRFGRAGRRQQPSLGVLVASSRSARPVRRAASGVLRRRAARTRAHRAGPAADPARPHPLRRVRAAVPSRRDASARSIRAVYLEVLAEDGVRASRTASAGTGSPTAIRPTR